MAGTLRASLGCAILLLPSLVFGGTDEVRSGVVDVAYATRVLHFDHTRNAISPEGVIAVCFPPNDSAFGKNTCSNSKGENQWQDIFTIDIPGHRLVGFEYRIAGTGAWRQLFLYFRKKDN